MITYDNNQNLQKQEQRRMSRPTQPNGARPTVPPIPAATHVEVFLDPRVGSLPVLEAEVTVRVPPRKIFLGHAARRKIILWREVLGDALQRLTMRQTSTG